MLRIFGSDRISGLMGKMGMEEGEPIEHSLISKAIENAQRRVEGHNFEIRKHLIEFDDVMNQQREVIYGQRRKVLEGQELREMIREMTGIWWTSFWMFVNDKIPPKNGTSNPWPTNSFSNFPSTLGFNGTEPLPTRRNLEDQLQEQVWSAYLKKVETIGPEVMDSLEQMVMLETIDTTWKDHLLSMDHLKEGIGLRGYGQRDPLREYQREGYEMFVDMVERIKEQTVANLFRLQLAREEDLQPLIEPQERPMFFSHSGEEGLGPEKKRRKEGRKK